MQTYRQNHTRIGGQTHVAELARGRLTTNTVQTWSSSFHPDLALMWASAISRQILNPKPETDHLGSSTSFGPIKIVQKFEFDVLPEISGPVFRDSERSEIS